MSTLRRNLVANFVGRGWGALLAFVLVPVYLRLLGVEAYGLVGFFAMLQAFASLTDMGLGMTLNRELARLSVQPNPAREQRDVLRTLEVVFVTMASCAGLVIVVASGWIATNWIGASKLPTETLTRTVMLMGVVLALQLPAALYQGGLLGLQRQALVNGIIGGFGTLRGLGAILVLWRFSNSVEAFFAWQALVSAAQTVTTGALLWRNLAGPAARPRLRVDILRRVWRYAAGIAGSTIVGAGLTQADKLILSSILPLREFGYYTLAWSVVALLWSLIQPVTAAFFPRLIQLLELGDEDALAGLYHSACQLVAVLAVPVALTVAAMPWDAVYLWTRDPAVADNVALLVRLLMLGTLLNVLMQVPFLLQMAAGWSQLLMWANTVGAVLLVPAIVVLTPRYGAPGAAVVWFVLNLGYVLLCVPIMHRRLLRREKGSWYRVDFCVPLAAAGAVTLVGARFAPHGGSLVATAVCLGATWAAAVAAVILMLPQIRKALRARLRRRPGHNPFSERAPV